MSAYRTKSNYLTRLKLGYCVSCTRQATRGVRCEGCAEKNRARAAKQYEQRRATA